jgi:hypothetical protein
MIKSSICFLLFLFLFLSCQKETFPPEKCEELSMNTFRGDPKSAYAFKSHCQNVPIVHTAEHCQSALNKFIMTGSLELTKKEFGEKVHLCFTKNDLEKFGKKVVK